MRNLAFGILTMLVSLSAMADTITAHYDCSTTLPSGSAEVIVFDSGKITLHFYNQSGNQTYTGVLQVNSSEAGQFIAAGNVTAYEMHPVIPVSLYGSTSLADEESFQLYAGADRRIEFGYGNILHCKKQ